MALPLVTAAAAAQSPCVIRNEAAAHPRHGITARALARCRVVPVADIARAIAPILWFHDDEPLLTLQVDGHPSGWLPERARRRLGYERADGAEFRVPVRRRPMPVALPFESVSPYQAVVYYRLRGVLRRGESLLADLLGSALGRGEAAGYDSSDATVDLAKVRTLRLQYLFYYPWDVGGGGHMHDLESAEFWLDVDRAPLAGRESGQTDSVEYELRLAAVVGHAHGHRAFANKLVIRRGELLAFPVTLLVEYGKHAVAPDREANGVFTPGVDVNQMINDAWGVRDAFGWSWLGQRSYAAWMTLPRRAGLRAYPPDTTSLPDSAWRYELRSFTELAQDPNARDDPLLRRFLDQHKYKAPPTAGVHMWTLFEGWGAGLRTDSRWLGAYLSLPLWRELPIIGGYPVGTVAVGSTWRGEPWTSYSILYAPSAIGFASWYGGVTQFSCRECADARVGFGPEGGAKLRIPIPSPTGPKVVGVRVGLRAVGFAVIRQPGVVAEIGTAIW